MSTLGRVKSIPRFIDYIHVFTAQFVQSTLTSYKFEITTHNFKIRSRLEFKLLLFKANDKQVDKNYQHLRVITSHSTRNEFNDLKN